MAEEITFADFEKIDLRIGKIIEATQVPESKKLIKILVDFGSEKRQAVAGLLKYYKPEELVGKKCVFLLNLQRRMLAGIESQCMILALKTKQATFRCCSLKKILLKAAKSANSAPNSFYCIEKDKLVIRASYSIIYCGRLTYGS